MKTKKILSVIILVNLVILSSVSCVKIDKDYTKTETESVKTTVNRKEENKESGEDKEKLISEIPHILLEESDGAEYYSEYRCLYYINNVHLKLKENGKEFEPLIKAFDKYNKETDKIYEYDRTELLSYPHPADEEDTEDENTDYFEKTPSVNTTTYVVRADKSIVSVINYKHAYYGGENPEYHRYSYNFDTATGKELEFRDIVKDEEKFFEIADERAKEYYPDNEFKKPSEHASEGGKEITWTANAEGVSVYFDIYDHDSYMEYPQVITVYFDEAKDLFEPKYTNTEDEYVILLMGDMKLSLDIDGDGKKELVHTEKVNSVGEEVYDSEYSGAKIFVGDKESERYDGYDYQSYIIKKSGKYYMYMFMDEIDDAKILYRADLSTLEKEDEFRTVRPAVRVVYSKQNDNNEKYHVIKETFTDAKSFVGDFGYDTLGTNTSEIEWIIDDKGYPVTAGNRYKITNGRILYTLADIKCTEVDEKGQRIKDTTLPGNSYILLLHTDNENYVDVRVTDKKYVDENKWYGEERYFELNDQSLLDYDGPCYRIELEHSHDEYEWGIKVNGVKVDKLFEGIMYSS